MVTTQSLRTAEAAAREAHPAWFRRSDRVHVQSVTGLTLTIHRDKGADGVEYWLQTQDNEGALCPPLATAEVYPTLAYAMEAGDVIVSRFKLPVPEQPNYQTELLIPESAWRASGTNNDERGRLTFHVRLNGLPFYLEAFRVRENDDGVQECASPCEVVQAWFADYAAASSNQSGPFPTITIRSETYAVFGTV